MRVCVESLFEEHARLNKDHDDTKLDLKAARDHNRILQREVSAKDNEIHNLRQIRVSLATCEEDWGLNRAREPIIMRSC